MTDRKPQDQDRYIVRFPDGMRERLKKLASDNGRSLNQEIILRLQRTLDNEFAPVAPDFPLAERSSSDEPSSLDDLKNWMAHLDEELKRVGLKLDQALEPLTDTKPSTGGGGVHFDGPKPTINSPD